MQTMRVFVQLSRLSDDENKHFSKSLRREKKWKKGVCCFLLAFLPSYHALSIRYITHWSSLRYKSEFSRILDIRFFKLVYNTILPAHWQTAISILMPVIRSDNPKWNTWIFKLKRYVVGFEIFKYINPKTKYYFALFCFGV